MRPSGRQPNQLRPISLEAGVTRYAEGSCLAKFGHTHVLCTASWAGEVPRWKKGKGEGWVTGEYGMLPRATHTRGRREATEGKQSGRTQEIQRLIGRALRGDIGRDGHLAGGVERLARPRIEPRRAASQPLRLPVEDVARQQRDVFDDENVRLQNSAPGLRRTVRQLDLNSFLLTKKKWPSRAGAGARSFMSLYEIGRAHV